MKDQTKIKIKALVAKYGKYGVSSYWCADALDEMDYTISDAKALTLLEAVLTNKFEPEQLTDEQKELVKHQRARDQINVSYS